MSVAVTRADVVAGLADLGLEGRPVVVHASLKSVGWIEGGAAAVADALIGTCSTVLAPAFNFDSNCPPPDGDRPRQNGADYAFYENWSRPRVPWFRESARIDPAMGSLPQALRDVPGTLRSDHPWHSWLAHGPDAQSLLVPHSWGTTNPPLERLAGIGGLVLLVGVGLTSCTAVHVAEERAGRRPFIRWNVHRDGVVRRIHVTGCAKGFDRLWPSCMDVFRYSQIGQARVYAADLSTLLGRLAEVIRSRPELTACSATCLRCRDAVRGGPLRENERVVDAPPPR